MAIKIGTGQHNKIDVGLNEDALTAAHLAVEDVLIEMRDARMSTFGRANGFVCNERDGTPSGIMRLGTRDGLRIAIEAYLKAEHAV
jgi:hypothetical protein